MHDIIIAAGNSGDNASSALATLATKIAGKTSTFATELGTTAATADGTANGGEAAKSLPMAVSTATSACSNAFNQIAWKFQ